MTAGRTIGYLRLDAIKPHPENPKLHSIAELKDSIRRFGFTQPVLVDDRTGLLAAGHGRIEALKAMLANEELAPTGVKANGGRWLVPVVQGWASADDDEARAYLLADNRLTEVGGYDEAALRAILGTMPSMEALLGTGYSPDDVAAILGDSVTPGLTDTDEAPPLPRKARTKPGDLWTLGSHRVLCGDATKTSDYEKLLAGAKVALLLTDPPYGVSIGEKNEALNQVGRNPAGHRPGGRLTDRLAGDLSPSDVEVLWRAAFPVMRGELGKGVPYYVFGPQGGELGLLLLLLREADLAARHVLIWAKHRASFSLGRLDYEYAHEPIVYGWTEGKAHPWYAKGTETSLLEHDRPTASKLHPTMKPVSLLENLILNSTKRGDVVLDPFGGSGSTLIAAENLGRRAYLLEIDGAYCDVIAERWEAFTGKKAILEKPS